MIEFKPYTNWDEIQPIFEWGCKKAKMESYEIDAGSKAIQNREIVTFVFYDEIPKGFLSFRIIDYCSLSIMFIDFLYIYPGYKKVILKVWEVIKGFAKLKGCQQIRCMTKRAGIIKYYEKLGLKPVATELSMEVI